MTAPVLTPQQRRAIGWGLVAVTLALVVALAIAVYRRASGAMAAAGRPAPPTIEQQLVVEHLRDVANLVASEMTLRDVVTFEQTRLGSTKRALLIVTGRVSAGIDLAQGADVRIDSVARRIVVALPPARVTSIEVLDVTTYDERAGLLNPFRPDDRDLIQRRIRTQLEAAARQSGILEHADRSAEALIRDLLGRDGYTVEVERPVVERRPVG
jgi:hypothetical protein